MFLFTVTSTKHYCTVAFTVLYNTRGLPWTNKWISQWKCREILGQRQVGQLSPASGRSRMSPGAWETQRWILFPLVSVTAEALWILHKLQAISLNPLICTAQGIAGYICKTLECRGNALNIKMSYSVPSAEICLHKSPAPVHCNVM